MTDQTVVHSSKHCNEQISDLFFKDLEFPKPHHNLEVGTGPHARQAAQIMECFETLLFKGREEKGHWDGHSSARISEIITEQLTGISSPAAFKQRNGQ